MAYKLNPLTGLLDITGTSGGGGAPTDAQYVVLALNAGLTGERVLTAGTGITITDGGANNPVTISLTVPLQESQTRHFVMALMGA